ncbi:L,D-transpeptidase family protein [Planosporangium thailandense]|uniref:L,D-transpeptidase family protein n=1 Tax=Planosporangium thailandense TaxID=765197 RepID=A0ABX0XZ47_9ACTN|nr:Ig-like domain-containing protein [Planosporangium thailandense]NJC70478.1 L,D-transpeptidase family protein [Planosporangium thailandense]
MKRQRRAVLLTALAATLALSGCGGTANRFVKPGASASPTPALHVNPADNATDIPVSAEVGLQDAGDKLTAVQLADAGGKSISGKLRDDASSWVPDEPLDYATTYTAKVTATSTSGKSVTGTSRFTTMQRPTSRMDAHLYMSDNAVYGQAMPIVVEFKQGGVAPADRAAVERRLFVTSDPPQPGVWHWDSNTQVEYRPKDFWQPSTKIHGRFALGGLPVGGGRYGQQDITIDASIDTVRRQIEVDNATKQLTAKQDGAVVKTMAVSLGSPQHPSFYGTMPIMEKYDKTTFDSSTYGTPVNSPEGYRTDVQYAERLTWDGQFIHAAPWSVAQQGHTNVSHGCVNVSTDNGQWIYDWVKVGDPVIVKGTEVPLGQGNGWTAWNLPWDQYVKGSALADVGQSTGATPAPSATDAADAQPNPSAS